MDQVPYLLHREAFGQWRKLYPDTRAMEHSFIESVEALDPDDTENYLRKVCSPLGCFVRYMHHPTFGADVRDMLYELLEKWEHNKHPAWTYECLVDQCSQADWWAGVCDPTTAPPIAEFRYFVPRPFPRFP